MAAGVSVPPISASFEMVSALKGVAQPVDRTRTQHCDKVLSSEVTCQTHAGRLYGTAVFTQIPDLSAKATCSTFSR